MTALMIILTMASAFLIGYGIENKKDSCVVPGIVGVIIFAFGILFSYTPSL